MQQSNDPSGIQKVQPMVTLATASGSQVTKLIFTNNTTLANHGVSQSITTVGGQPILLSSPQKTVTISKNVIGSQHIIKPLPGTPTKQTVYVLPPMKTAQKLGNVSAQLKSPIRIAPAASMSFPALLASKVPLASAASNSMLTKTITIQQSPKKVLVKPLLSSVNASASTSNFASPVNPVPMQVSSSGATSHQVQLSSSSRLHYVRLVSASGSSVTTTITSKTSTISNTPTSTNVSPAITTSVTSSGPQIRLSLPMSSASGQKQPLAIKTAQKIISGSSVAQIRSSNQLGQINQIPPGTLIPICGSGGQSYVVVPANYITQMQQSTNTQNPNQTAPVVFQNVNIVRPPTTVANSTSELGEPRNILPVSNLEPTSSRPSFIPIAPSALNNPRSPIPPPSPLPMPCRPFLNGRLSLNSCDTRPRKPCNCTKSQCLKLYCECFANGEFCNSCNCNNCYNNLVHEIERQKAIKACLDRNPMAFHPKIGKTIGTDKERRHTKGCNCRRSGCLKNYCECYEAKILCTNLCRCAGCKNFEDSSEKKTLLHLADAAEVRVQQAAATANLSSQMLRLPIKHLDGLRKGQLPSAYITDEVIGMTVECLMAQAKEAESQNLSAVEGEHLLLEEFGRCLRTLISFTNEAADSESEADLSV